MTFDVGTGDEITESGLPQTSIDQSVIACKYGIGALVEDEFGSECSVI